MPEQNATTDNILTLAKAGIARVGYTDKEKHIKTGDIRRLSAELYISVGDKSKDSVFVLCDKLLEDRSWAMSVIAYDFALRVKKNYTPEDFRRFEGWLIEYVRGWGDCDDFCTHAFGELLLMYPELFEKIIPWTEREEFWLRRAAAVILIPAIKRGEYSELKPYLIADRLLADGHDLVRKGYGWMLKELAEKEPEEVCGYLRRNSAAMPRVAFRYAIEKLDAATRRELMAL